MELRIRPDGRGADRPAGRTATSPLATAQATGDEPGVAELLRTSIEDLRALLLRDPVQPTDRYLAAGAPWRCGPAPAEALAAARMALPLGTGLAAGTLRALARTQLHGPGPSPLDSPRPSPFRGPESPSSRNPASRPLHATRQSSGMIPGPLRDAGPHLPPGCTGTEATLLFPVLLAEARRWGLPDSDTEELLPAAERCLTWLLTTPGDGPYVADPQPGGPVRCETQAHAHRAALLGADLLDACGRPGGAALREWRSGCARRSAGTSGSTTRRAAGRRPPGCRTEPSCRTSAPARPICSTPACWAGAHRRRACSTRRRPTSSPGCSAARPWTRGGAAFPRAREAGHNPFGHRSGAVRVHETAVAVAGLAAAGYEKEASSLLRGVLAAADAFGHRLPEMYAGERRTDGGVPLPHPAACRPAATAAAAGVLLLTALAGVRPDVPAGTVTLRPVRSAPLGEVGLTGLRVAGAPFSVRVSRLGLAMVEEAADGLQLGV